MSDPDRTDDAEPTGYLPASGEGPDADADETTRPIDRPPDDAGAGSSEHDADDLLRWLPTLALGHRRRTELVERPSSDGADFAVYAAEGRPAAASGQPRVEPVLKVQSALHGVPPRSKDPERDAPTVLTRERSAQRRWRSIRWAALGVVAAGIWIAAWAWRPVPAEKESPRGHAVSLVPIASTPTQLAEPAQSTAAPFEPPTQESPAEVTRMATDRRTVLASAPAADVARKKDSAGPPKPLPSSARGRTAPLSAAPTVLTKDQYFEAP
jgi:hypothetical protein